MKLFSVAFNYEDSVTVGVYRTLEKALFAAEDWMCECAKEWDAEENTEIAITRSFNYTVNPSDPLRTVARCEYACFEAIIVQVQLDNLQ